MSGNLHFNLKCVPRVHQKGSVAGGSEKSFSLDSRAATLHQPQHVLLTRSPLESCGAAALRADCQCS